MPTPEGAAENPGLQGLQAALDAIDLSTTEGRLSGISTENTKRQIEECLQIQRRTFELLKTSRPGTRNTHMLFFPWADQVKPIWKKFQLDQKPTDDPIFLAFLDFVGRMMQSTQAVVDKRTRGRSQEFAPGVNIIINGQRVRSSDDLPPGINIGMSGTRRAAAETLEGGTPGTSIGKKIAAMDGEALEAYILSFEKGEITDGTMLLLMGRIKELKKSGGITNPEAVKLMADAEDRLSDN